MTEYLQNTAWNSENDKDIRDTMKTNSKIRTCVCYCSINCKYYRNENYYYCFGN